MKGAFPARWWEPPDARGKIRCTLCPRGCRLLDGQPGFCFVRQRQGNALVTLGYGRSTGFAVDPIEKKPLYHFYPGTGILSFGTAGCNLGCKFCQNWTSSKARSVDAHSQAVPPERVVELAREQGCPAIAFTYNDPIIFAEYAIDVAALAREAGVRTVAVTAGYVSPGPREAFFSQMDAANVDLKSMSEAFYWKLCSARLGPILETLEYLARETNVWVEVTNLVIPGHNDTDTDFDRLSVWIVEHMGAGTPIHFSAFHPDFKLRDVGRTPATTLARAREIATGNGARHVFTGNVMDERGQSTYCHNCGALLISRQWYQIADYRLDDQGRCRSCGTPADGRFSTSAGAVEQTHA